MKTPCPKCGSGWMVRDRDHAGDYDSCVICGCTVDLDASGAPTVPLPQVDGHHGSVPMDRRRLPLGARWGSASIRSRRDAP